MVPLPNNLGVLSTMVYVYIACFLLVHFQINLNFNQYKRQIGDGQVVTLWVAYAHHSYTGTPHI